MEEEEEEEEEVVFKKLMITRLMMMMMGNSKTFKRRIRVIIDSKIKMITMMIWMS